MSQSKLISLSTLVTSGVPERSLASVILTLEPLGDLAVVAIFPNGIGRIEAAKRDEIDFGIGTYFRLDSVQFTDIVNRGHIGTAEASRRRILCQVPNYRNLSDHVLIQWQQAVLILEQN